MNKKALWLFAIGPFSSLCLAEGEYGAVPIDEDEQRILIDASSELEGYFASQSLIYNDEELLRITREIGHELAPPPSDDYVSYQFFILRDPSPNAFALPNGHVYITTGMLARLEDEAQLAAILSHEISHIAGHHGILEDRARAKKQVALAVISGLGGVAGANYELTGDMASGWAQVVSDVISYSLAASVYGFRRELEQEADNGAVNLMIGSPYDAFALPEVLDILRQDYEGLNPRVSTVWSTHPELELRIAIAIGRVAGLPVKDRDADAFRIAVHSARALTIQDYIQDDYPQTAVALAESMTQRSPNDPRALQLLGDAWRGMGGQDRIDPEEWSQRDKRRNLRDRRRKTREERLADQLKSEEGKAAYAKNLSRAEEKYQQALELNPFFADPHRGLGEVYEQLNRPRDAAASYLAYVRSAPDAPDRVVIIDRLRSLNELIRTQNQRESQ